MAKTLQTIWDELPEDRRERLSSQFEERLEAYQTLQALRKALDYTQEAVAETLQIHQVNVSKLEKRADLKLSTLRDYLTAMGGRLRLVVDFPGRPSVLLQGFGDGDDFESVHSQA
jgi:transcriptional regulator with XRE-family HTH domain